MMGLVVQEKRGFLGYKAQSNDHVQSTNGPNHITAAKNVEDKFFYEI